jgi:hypothetical protein
MISTNPRLEPPVSGRTAFESASVPKAAITLIVAARIAENGGFGNWPGGFKNRLTVSTTRAAGQRTKPQY